MAPTPFDWDANVSGLSEPSFFRLRISNQVSGNGRLSRLRLWVLILTVVVVFGAFFAPVTIIYTFNKESAESQLAVSCTVLRTERHQLEAIAANRIYLEQIIRDLGLPVAPLPPIVIPEVPPECDDT